MSNLKYNLLELDVDKLFEECTINEIIELEKLLDLEIEKKRSELRGMVGDRYKDVLIASDAIKSMQSISETIVTNIDNITTLCDELSLDTDTQVEKQQNISSSNSVNERTVIMQIRLAMVAHNQIWVALEEENFLRASELYLLAQHIHTGLRLLNKDTLNKLVILKRMKSDVDSLRSRILNKVKEKLKVLELDMKDATNNLISLILLEQPKTDLDLLKSFLNLRKIALSTVIKKQHESVRLEVQAMLRCLVVTIHLLHQCFINFNNTKTGFIWQELDNIIGAEAPSTLAKIKMPLTPLVIYIPEIIQQFRPKCHCEKTKLNSDSAVIEEWLLSTKDAISKDVKNSLSLISNIKGLHLIREEALKIKLPAHWEDICMEISKQHFHPWYYFFQYLITDRAKCLISKKIKADSLDGQNHIKSILESVGKTDLSEDDLRWHIWSEEEDDISRTENKHLGLSMKTKGYSPNIVRLCLELDSKYLECLKDLSLYLYGFEYDNNNKTLPEDKSRKNVDKTELEQHLKEECSNHLYALNEFLRELVRGEGGENVDTVKSLTCARFFQALAELCPNLRKCCSPDKQSTNWDEICQHFSKCSFTFYQYWLNNCVNEIESVRQELRITNVVDMLWILPKWDTIEIQEQTDEKVFKSQIRIPFQPSLCLQKMFTIVNNQLSNVLPHTLPRNLHQQYVENIVKTLLDEYEALATCDLNQIQSLQFLFDVKFITTLCIPKENMELISQSQTISNSFRSKIDPFDLDVFYSYIQTNVKVCVLQCQVIFGCLLPSANHLTNLGVLEKNKDLEKQPSVLAVSVPTTSSWFPLLPVTTPLQKIVQSSVVSKEYKVTSDKQGENSRKATSVSSVRSGAAAFFGAVTTDWFS